MKKRKGKPEDFSDLDPAGMTEDEKRIADNTRILMKSVAHETFHAADKEMVWNKVEEGVERRMQISYRRVWLALAASVTLLLLSGLGYILLKNNTGRMMQETASRITLQSENTQLVLADQRKVDLRHQNSRLEYQHDGAVIRIDSAADIDQNIQSGRQVFNTLIVPYGKRSVLTLADGSRIWVNSGSKLVYPARFNDTEREVFLEGQAYFSVSHSAEVPFFVHTKNMKVQVHGTEFDVSAYDDDKETAAVLVTGSIELTANEHSLFNSINKKVTPGTRTTYDPASRKLTTSKINTVEYVSWKEGYLQLEKAPLNEILRKLSRYYRAEIAVDEVAPGQTFSGRLDLQEDVRQVLNIISAATSLNYQQTERRFLFESKTINP